MVGEKLKNIDYYLNLYNTGMFTAKQLDNIPIQGLKF